MEEQKKQTPTEALKYFVDELLINKQEPYALELADIMGHILTRTSQRLGEHHEAEKTEGEHGTVSRLHFNAWVLEAIGEVAQFLFKTNEKIMKDAENVSADTEEGGEDSNQQ